ncbi:AIR synthase-related protein, partial [Alcanivorax sp.]
IGLGASGPHSNGYSLIRRIMAQAETDIDLDGKPLIEHLLEPTRIYVKSLLKLIEQVPVHAMAHITGGGLPENLPRVLPDNTRAVIDTKSWEFPAVFQWLQQEGQVPAFEMYRTFNCGVGMVIAVPASHVDDALALLEAEGESAFLIGEIQAGDGQPDVVLDGLSA